MKKHGIFYQSMLNGLTFGAIVGVGLFLFNSMGDKNLKERLITLAAAAIAALIGGVLLGLVLYLYEYLRGRKFEALRAELSEQGELLAEEKASRIENGRRISGRLFLTDTAVLFRPNSDSGEQDRMLRAEISHVQITDPRLCHITLTSAGKEATYAVPDPRTWFDLLGETDAPSADPEPLPESESEKDPE